MSVLEPGAASPVPPCGKVTPGYTPVQQAVSATVAGPCQAPAGFVRADGPGT